MLILGSRQAFVPVLGFGFAIMQVPSVQGRLQGRAGQSQLESHAHAQPLSSHIPPLGETQGRILLPRTDLLCKLWDARMHLSACKARQGKRYAAEALQV